MTGVVAILAGGGGFAGAVTAPNANPSDLTVNIAAVASFALLATGLYTSTNEAGGSYVSPTSLTSQLSAKMTYISGTAVSGAATGIWLSLTSDRTWSLSAAVGNIHSSTYLLEIRETATGMVLSSSTINFSAESEALP